jgi:hypothetical protein
MKHAQWALIVFSLAPGRAAMALPRFPQQADPVVAAARKAREQKQSQAKAPKVWDNDNIPKSARALSVIGPAPSAPDSHSGDSGSNTDKKPTDSGEGKTAPAAPAAQKSALEAELAAAKEQMQTLQNDLDILQRKYNLDQQTYYARPDYASDKAGAADLRDEQDQIDAKQQEMTAEQQKVADFQAKLGAVAQTPGGETKKSE